MLSEELAQIDLSALQALVMVNDCRSFSEASERLGVNQSTISYSIKRLRKAFNDPMFVRQGNSILSTDKCRQLAQEARDVLERMQALSSLQGFDPATSTGSVTISCN
ncbi:MAG: LysR family transcriptional regulator, partial [Mesorhizobium sp.]